MIQTQNLFKQYKNLVAVKNLNLTIDEGDIFGFIGPNGAGKTTTIKMLATLIRPSAGSAFIGGINVVDHPREVRRVIGYMPDFFGVYDDMKVWEYLDFFAAAYKIERHKRRQIIDDVLALTDLEVKREEFVESLSRGMKQRLCLAKTLVHDPKVLLLDEPASGLDPRARIEMRELLKELRRMGKTILISSHILSELADFCNKIGIIEKGVLLESGEVDSIMQRMGFGRIFEITVRENAELAREMIQNAPGVIQAALAEAKDGEENGFRPASNGPAIDVEVDATITDPADLIATLVQGGIKVTGCKMRVSNLEEIFLTVTKGIVS